MATADLYYREVKANKSPRNAFDMGYSTLFSSPAGMLLPSYIQEVKRGDKLKLGVRSLTRAAPVVTPAFMTFDEKTDFWFVPYRLIWSDYDNWRLGQTFRNRTTMLDGSGTQNFLPFTSFSSLGNWFSTFVRPSSGRFFVPTPSSALRYLDLLGYSVSNEPDYISQISVNEPAPGDFLTDLGDYYTNLSKSAPCNYFRLAAFQCVYMHCYRNEEYEVLDPSYYNVDNLFYPNNIYDNIIDSTSTFSSPSYLVPDDDGSSAGLSRLSWSKLFMPRYKNWRKDVFTSAKPNNGFAVGTSGLGFTNPIGASSLYGSGFYWPTQDLNRRFPNDGDMTDQDSGRYSPLNIPSGDTGYSSTRADWTYQFDGSTPANVVQRLYTEVRTSSSGSFGLTALYPQNIRNLMAQDKFSRSVIYADKDISSQIKALFGENYEDNDTPVYLGSYSTNINIDDVVATAAGDSGFKNDLGKSVLGQMSGRVKQGNDDGKVFERDFRDDGVVIGVHYVMPRNNYDSYRLNKFNTKISRFDYFYPQFDGLGYQPVLNYERFIDGTQLIGANPPYVSALFGFAPRYYEYKQRTNEVHGTFMYNQNDMYWTLTNNSGSNNHTYTASNPLVYKISPDITDRIFVTSWNGAQNTDPFYHYYYYDATLVSDMEVYGTPSL